jgi:hypothetical protein
MIGTFANRIKANEEINKKKRGVNLLTSVLFLSEINNQIKEKNKAKIT